MIVRALDRVAVGEAVTASGTAASPAAQGDVAVALEAAPAVSVERVLVRAVVEALPAWEVSEVAAVAAAVALVAAVAAAVVVVAVVVVAAVAEGGK